MFNDKKFSKILSYVLLVIALLSLFVSGVDAQEFIETPSATYGLQTYNRGTGYFYKVGVEDLNLTSVKKASIDQANNLVIYNNGSSKYFEYDTWIDNVMEIGIKLNASTTYAIMLYPDGCANRQNAHDTGLSGTYPIATNKGSITGGVLSSAICGQPEIYIDSDSYSIDEWNVSVIGGGLPPDTVPPVVTDVNQIPLNITDLNIMGTLVNITVNITDNIMLNQSTILINVSLNNTEIYVNGSLMMSNFTSSYFSNLSDIYLFQLDEEDILSGTYNIDPEIMEDTNHLNSTLTGANQWLKMKFFNVSNNKSQVFTEIYDENATATEDLAEYYYCNSTYTTGNPITSNYCRLFAETSNKIGYNHTHHGGKSKHKIIPMGINIIDGTLNGLLVTETLYILKRGTVAGERYFYISNVSRVDQIQTTNNNGNTWNDFSGTVDAHIHQFGLNESLNYEVCASDNSSNKGCSGWFSDLIDIAIFPPNAVTIFRPIDDDYNITLVINHSVSGSASGQSITGYQYEYKQVDNLIWIEIKENNYPETGYNWDISSLLNDDYHIKITVTDSLNLTSETVSEVFSVVNPLSVTEQLLTEQNTLLSNIFEVIEMLGWVFLIIIFLILGVFVNYLFWGVSGLVFWIMTILNTMSGTFSENLAVNIFYILIGVLLMFGGVIMEIGKSSKKDTKKDMYSNFYDV